MIDEINLDLTGSLSWTDQGHWVSPPETFPQVSAIDSISADLKNYFFHKMEKKGISEAEKIFDQYLKAGFLPKAAIALTDRKFFPAPHKAGHGNYLRTVIGNELFQKEQAARKEASEASSKKSKSHTYTKQMQTSSSPAGQYMLGIGEMAVGVGLMAAGAAAEIGSFGTLTVAVAFEEAAAVALVADGLARTMLNKDISFDRTVTPATWNSSDAAWKNSDVYAPDRPLPRDPHTKEPVPETDAPHTELGTKDGDKGKYPQAREFNGDGNWIRDIDFTDHGRRQNHPCPHQHECLPNPTGGTPKRDPFGKEVPEWSYE